VRLQWSYTTLVGRCVCRGAGICAANIIAHASSDVFGGWLRFVWYCWNSCRRSIGRQVGNFSFTSASSAAQSGEACRPVWAADAGASVPAGAGGVGSIVSGGDVVKCGFGFRGI
jgi:hypothetical protein